MTGMNRHTGQAIDGDDDLAQSLSDILTTLLGTRACRRDYGGLLPLLVDQPLNAALLVRLYASSALAIARWEKRIRVSGFNLTATADGKAAMTIIGTRRDGARANSLVRLTIPLTLS